MTFSVLMCYGRVSRESLRDLALAWGVRNRNGIFFHDLLDTPRSPPPPGITLSFLYFLIYWLYGVFGGGGGGQRSKKGFSPGENKTSTLTHTRTHTHARTHVGDSHSLLDIRRALGSTW